MKAFCLGESSIEIPVAPLNDFHHGSAESLTGTLSTSSVEFYLKMGTLYTDLVGHEAFLDRYLELLKRDQLEETVSLSPLNDSLAYLVNLHAVHLSNQPVANCFALMQNFASAVLASSEAISMQVVTLAVFSDQVSVTLIWA
ncbi:unnamed protein product [Protopolystoma xenopodis]|uniref:Dynein associated protein domain-containing protein n=1 Tax=Protopolystoma xenopodis TaxID=117903 RepID=A0A448XL86_9PLAT|nr:unnamed protein product [Protopolystoma xenopodis]